MVKDRLSQSDAQEKGWLLDGYPRSESQAEAIEAEGIRPDVFILLEVNVYYNALNYLSFRYVFDLVLKRIFPKSQKLD